MLRTALLLQLLVSALLLAAPSSAATASRSARHSATASRSVTASPGTAPTQTPFPLAAMAVVSTLAGGGRSLFSGAADGVGTAARFNQPSFLAPAANGMLYISDAGSTIRVLNTSSVAVTTLCGGGAGFADGVGTAARFNNPAGLALDSASTILYTADSGNQLIRVTTLATGAVTTLAGSLRPSATAGFADGVGAAAAFFNPIGAAISASDDRLFITEIGRAHV
jgi:DNA-binding beta-propeller fold protein YncE